MRIQCQDDKDSVIEIPADTLAGADLTGRSLHRAMLEKAKMTGARCVGTNLRGAFLHGADLRFSDLTDASLITALLDYASLRSAKLVRTRAMAARFDGASLVDADLTDAEVTGANFEGADLRGTAMLCEGLDNARMQGAIYDSRTRWPEGFRPAKSGARLRELVSVRISLSSFYSKGDENRFFWGLEQNPAVVHFRGVETDLVVRLEGHALDRMAAKDLIALLWRYGISIKPLAVLFSHKKYSWVRDKKGYWYKSLYPKK